MISEQIRDVLRSALSARSYVIEHIALDHPSDLSHGDFSTNVALALAKEARRNPRELAEEIVALLPHAPFLEKVEVAGPGFINFHLARSFFIDTTLSILEEPVAWGTGSTNRGKKVLVEHTQPNPFKPFHIGHLMSNTLGESISRLIQNSGAEVRRANYQGDVGLHVAKALWGLRKLSGDPHSIADLGRAYVAGNSAYEDDTQAKAEIVELNKKVYAHAPDILETYQAGREVSLAHFEELYRILGTKFDYYFFESAATLPGRALVAEGLARGIFSESEGAVVFRGEEYGLHTRVFLTKEGLPTYEAKELGLQELKAEKWDFDESITTTAVEQKQYFEVVHKALSLLHPNLGARMHHVTHGMMLLSEGKMSSRKGNIITGESLIEDMRVLAYIKVKNRDLPDEEKERVAQAVCVAAIKYSTLKQKAGKNIVFNPDEALSFEGSSGPYLQYAHTRARSVLVRAAEEGVVAGRGMPSGNTSVLERLLYRFPQVAARAVEEYEPHFVTTYLTELAGAWNSWYAVEKILDLTPSTPYKLALATVFAATMKNGLWLLGIEAPERM